jgi:hypothetical protein
MILGLHLAFFLKYCFTYKVTLVQVWHPNRNVHRKTVLRSSASTQLTLSYHQEKKSKTF